MKTFLAALLLILVPAASQAQWILDGTAVTAVPGTQEAPVALADGAGGVFIAWSDQRAGNFDVYAQRINSTAGTVWTSNGVAVCTAGNDQVVTGIAADGVGGAIITWQDARNDDDGIYLQRINAAGVTQWTANGVAVCNVGIQQIYPQIVSDGAGGAVVTWQDYRTTADFDVYAQRVNASGVPQWTANGVLLFARSFDQVNPGIVSAGVGGFIIVCEDHFFAPDNDIIAQRISPSGVNQWGPQGIYVSLSAGSEISPKPVSDGAGGAIIAWDNHGSGSYDVYIQRLNAAGSPLWGGNGFQLTNVTGDQGGASIVGDGNGGAVVAWNDWRGADADIYAQHVSSAGAATWLVNGVGVCTAPANQNFPSIVPDGSSGYIFTWQHYAPSGPDVYAQRVNTVGAMQWVANGKPVCQASASQGAPTPVSDGAGGTIFTWDDLRSGGYEIYAQRLDNVHGFPGHPEPILTSVADVKHDQGGFVAVNWKASDDDIINPRLIDFYSVWRAVDAIPSGNEALTMEGVKSRDLDAAAPAYIAVAGQYFERVGTQTAHAWPGYSFAASTRTDSIAGAASDEKFMVAAHSLSDNFVAFTSNVMTGHSRDNLAPRPPKSPSAQRTGSDVELHWNPVPVADLRDYAIYRSASSGFTPGPGNFLTTSEDTVLIDANAPSSSLYYVVTAYDVHGNQSAPSSEFAVGLSTNVGRTPALTAFTVLPNHPNPFGASTDLEIGLMSNSDVSIDVFDVAGRRVSGIEVKGARAGWNRIPFAGRDHGGRSLASGVYFYRVTAGGTSITRKLVIAR